MSIQIIDEINRIIESLTNLKNLIINNNNSSSENNLPYTVGRFTVREASPNSTSYRLKGINGGKTNKLNKLNKSYKGGKKKNKTKSTRKK